MSSKYNQLYGNSALNRALGNIAKTLVGSATDDAAIARANYLDSQTKGQDLKNKNVSGLSETINSFTNSPLGQSIAANMLGGNVDGSGNLVKQMPSSVERSVPLFGNQVNMNQEDINAQLSNLGKTIYGDQTYNPSQITDAYNNIKSGGNSSLANNMMKYGNQDEQQRAFKMMGKSPGQFFNPKIAEQKLKNDFDAKNFKTTTDAGVDERVGMNKNKLDANVKRIIGLDKNKKVDATARYKFDNRDITIAVGKDKQVFVDKATGVKLGIEPQTLDGKEVYILDGRQTVDKVEVKVGKADVYLNEETAKELGIPVNDQGQYIIEGSGFNDGTSGGGESSKKDAIKPKDFMKLVSDSLANEGNKPIFTDKLPGNIIGGVKKEMKKIYDKEIAKINAGTSKGDTSTAYIKTIEFIISRGVVDVSTGNFSSTSVPKFFYDSFLRTSNNVDVMTKWFQGIGYNKDIASKIANDIFTKRAQNG